jgi:thiol:disulfide interchange protein DsbG
MRIPLVLASLVASTSLATAAPPLCALPGPVPVAATAQAPVTPPQVPTASVSPANVGKAAPSGTAAALPADLQALAFARHVAASGATVNDLGMAHGLRRIVAHDGDQFMIFEVGADGTAAVSGAAVEITPDEIGSLAGPANVRPLGVSHGFSGYFVRSGTEFQVFYATPDGQRLIPGVLWGADGNDITRQQVAGIPGAVPTVEVTAGGSPQPGVNALPLVKKAAFGVVGAPTAPRIYMLMDPQCIYSIRAMQMLRPYIDLGRLQVAVVPLSVLDYEDKGASTQAALALLSRPADQIVSAWQARDLTNTPTPEAAQRLRWNMHMAEALGVKGTPTFVWQKADGTEGRVDGLPESVPNLVASLGS